MVRSSIPVLTVGKMFIYGGYFCNSLNHNPYDQLKAFKLGMTSDLLLLAVKQLTMDDNKSKSV